MQQSYLYITHTFINQKKAISSISSQFFTNNSLDIGTFQPVNDYTKLFDSYISQQKIVVPTIADKDDFRSFTQSISSVFAEPTLLFLGDISSYSEQLQEGMLKLFEEPPYNITVILFARSKSVVLPTIASRCSILSFTTAQTFNLLDEEKIASVKKALPDMNSFVKSYVTNKATIPDVSKVGRDEIELWLWQLQMYLEQIYSTNNSKHLANLLTRVIQAIKRNSENVQKKFVMHSLQYDS